MSKWIGYLLIQDFVPRKVRTVNRTATTPLGVPRLAQVVMLLASVLKVSTTNLDLDIRCISCSGQWFRRMLGQYLEANHNRVLYSPLQLWIAQSVWWLGHGLEDLGLIPVETGIYFLSHHVLTETGTKWASWPVGTGGPFPADKVVGA
jgi:hypothetical protein